MCRKQCSWLVFGLAVLALVAVPVSPVAGKGRRRRRCPRDMVSVRGRYCIDRYEAYTAVVMSRGRLRRHSPFKPVGDRKVMALNRRGRMPQAYISQRQAARACALAGKRLCQDDEWVLACKGKRPTTYPYGNKHKPKRCNDRGLSAFNLFFGAAGREAPQHTYTWENLNDPRLNKAKGTCAPSGRFRRCRNSFRAYDMVGNLHEWTAAKGGTFRGGYYLDVHKHGDGCNYKTTAHNPKYHDYSTGFRCCKTPGVDRKPRPAKKKKRQVKAKKRKRRLSRKKRSGSAAKKSKRKGRKRRRKR
jgi:formylglycine-generating enzyme